MGALKEHSFFPSHFGVVSLFHSLALPLTYPPWEGGECHSRFQPPPQEHFWHTRTDDSPLTLRGSHSYSLSLSLSLSLHTSHSYISPSPHILSISHRKTKLSIATTQSLVAAAGTESRSLRQVEVTMMSSFDSISLLNG